MAPVASQLIRTLEITNLPSLPHILLRVLDMCNRDEASLQAIADIIGKDTALSSKVIGVSNSALFGRQNNLASLEQKLALLGLDMVQTIAISSSVYQVFNNLSSSPEFDLKVFWRHSLTSAFLAKLLAQEISYPHPEEAYLTGLLLDVGQLVLWSNFPKQYAALLAEKVDGIQLMVRESEEIGNNHCEVGSWLVNSWNLNSFMADAVLYHHVPQDKIVDSHRLIQITHVANSLAKTDMDEEERILAGEKLLGITPVVFRQIITNTRELVSEVAKSLDIEIDTPPLATGGDSPPEKAERDNQRQKKMQLAMEVRDIALIDRNPLGARTATSLDNILLSTQRSAQIIFGFQDLIFFLPDPTGKILSGKCLTGYGMMANEMTIPLNKGNSMITDAFLTRTPGTFLGSEDVSVPSILDEQIIRLMQTEGFYCQPMTTRNSDAGIMVFGLSRAQLAQIKKQHKLVSMFAQQSALAVVALNAINEQETRIKYEVMASNRTRARQIVHEANNPLGVIRNYIKLLSVRLPKEDPAQEDLKIIKEEIDRVTRIFRIISVAAETEANPQEELNVNDVIQNLCRIFFEALFAQHQVTVQTQFDPALPSIVTDRDKLIQILINLMKNAVEAMQNGGTLLISTHGGIERSGRGYIEIALKDDGPGIPAEVMKNLFKPVATSKGAGHAGLGLSIVNSTVDELDGKIFCQSNEISGTVFQILLPLQPVGKA
ncbi:MAG: HDOD domain-containing protein [Sulfurimicrobium sp.]|nr:HDOD domain-containing protein [Sulfurimicrobium sp.]MDP2197599.1 HDOD domain-containing protein [Sulfurimicrobium sp.]